MPIPSDFVPPVLEVSMTVVPRSYPVGLLFVIPNESLSIDHQVNSLYKLMSDMAYNGFGIDPETKDTLTDTHNINSVSLQLETYLEGPNPSWVSMNRMLAVYDYKNNHIITVRVPSQIKESLKKLLPTMVDPLGAYIVVDDKIFPVDVKITIYQPADEIYSITCFNRNHERKETNDQD